MFTVEFLARYAVLLVGCMVLLRLIYFRITPNREAFFSFFLFANGVFLVTYLLHNIELSMGFAFGLFAVFAMLRYRTEPITIRDMTYLFVVIGMSLVASVANLSLPELIFFMALVCALAGAGETAVIAPRVVEKKINYDNVTLIKPDAYSQLISDLEFRTGFDIVKIEVGKIDFLSDSAQLVVFCREPSTRKVSKQPA